SSSQRRNHFLLEFALSEIEAEASLVDLRFTVGMVVQVRAKRLSFADPASHAFGINRRRGADGPNGENIKEAAAALSRSGGRGKEHRMMRDLATAWANLNSANPVILCDVQRNAWRRII